VWERFVRKVKWGDFISLVEEGFKVNRAKVKNSVWTA
jgi:hypothetical protein